MTPARSPSYCQEVSDDDLHSIVGCFPPQPHTCLLPITQGSAPLTSLPVPAPLPPPKEVINGNIKIVTEYKIDEDGKKFKVRQGEEVGALVLEGT